MTPVQPVGDRAARGGNRSTTGPTRGVPDGGGDGDGNADTSRIGYDCGGLVRYSVQLGAGFDVGMGTNSIDGNPQLGHVKGGEAIPSAAVTGVAKPGDVLVFEFPGSRHQPFSGAGTQHTGIYIGNGFMMNAPASGAPIRVDNVTEDGRRTDVLRFTP